MRIFFDVFYGSSKSCVLFQLNDTVCLQQQQCTCFVCRIIRNCDRIAVFKLVKCALCSRIDTERFIVDAARIYQVCSLLLVEILQIRNMLEVVCVKITTLYNKVRLNVIIKYGNLQIPALLLQKRFCLLQDLCMRCR